MRGAPGAPGWIGGELTGMPGPVVIPFGFIIGLTLVGSKMNSHSL